MSFTFLDIETNRVRELEMGMTDTKDMFSPMEKSRARNGNIKTKLPLCNILF